MREVRRFANEPVRRNGSLQWDILRLWREMRAALERVAACRLDSIGVDAWGCDYALLGERGDLLENPYHYRDARTDGVMEAVFERVVARARFTPPPAFSSCRSTRSISCMRPAARRRV